MSTIEEELIRLREEHARRVSSLNEQLATKEGELAECDALLAETSGAATRYDVSIEAARNELADLKAEVMEAMNPGSSGRPDLVRVTQALARRKWNCGETLSAHFPVPALCGRCVPHMPCFAGGRLAGGVVVGAGWVLMDYCSDCIQAPPDPERLAQMQQELAGCQVREWGLQTRLVDSPLLVPVRCSCGHRCF